MITDATEYDYVTIPQGVTIDSAQPATSLPMPVRDYVSTLVDDRAFRGVDPAFLLEAIGERRVAAWNTSATFTKYIFSRDVSRHPFLTTIQWLAANVGSGKAWRHKPQQAVRIAASSSDAFKLAYGNELSSSELTSGENDFALNTPPRRAGVLKIFDDLDLFTHFVTDYKGITSGATIVRTSAGYTVTSSYTGEEFQAIINNYNGYVAKYSSGGSAIGTSDIYFHVMNGSVFLGYPFNYEVTATLSGGTYEATPPATVSLSLWSSLQAYALIVTVVNNQATYYDWMPVSSTLDAQNRKLTVTAADVASAAAGVLSARGITVLGPPGLGNVGSQSILQTVADIEFAVDLGDHTDWKAYIEDVLGIPL